MKFEERHYSSHLIRPRPLVYIDPSEGFVLVMTAWGATETTQRALEHVKQYLQAVRQDNELTTPFQNILSLSDAANDLRVAALMANDLVFRNLNQDRYDAVFEICFLNIRNRRVAWSQMGCPHLFIRKKNQKPQPISCFPESRSELSGFPIPVCFLGSEPTIAPRCGDFYLSHGDEIILLSSSTIPEAIWKISEESSLEEWTDKIAMADGAQPFWLGRLQID